MRLLQMVFSKDLLDQDKVPRQDRWETTHTTSADVAPFLLNIALSSRKSAISTIRSYDCVGRTRMEPPFDDLRSTDMHTPSIAVFRILHVHVHAHDKIANHSS